MEGQAQSQKLYPACPHCGQDPATLASLPIQMGVLQNIVIFCGNPACRKIINVQVMAVEGPRVVPAGARSLERIVGA